MDVKHIEISAHRTSLKYINKNSACVDKITNVFRFHLPYRVVDHWTLFQFYLTGEIVMSMSPIIIYIERSKDSYINQV